MIFDHPPSIPHSELYTHRKLHERCLVGCIEICWTTEQIEIVTKWLEAGWWRSKWSVNAKVLSVQHMVHHSGMYYQ